jgi:flagellar motor switch protein FliN
MDTQPLSWLKQIHDELSLAQKIPLWGTPPDFPWEALSSAIQESLQIPVLSLEAQKRQVSSPKDFLSFFGDSPVVKSLEMAPLNGTVSLVISQESLKRISELILSSQENQISFTDPDLQEGFFQYLLLCASESFTNHSPYPDLHLQWLETKPLPSAPSYCSDLSLTLEGQTFPIRIIFSPEFHLSFLDHFANIPQDPFSSEMANSIDLTLKVETGSCLLKRKDWNRLNVGDFLILDTCSYDPLTRKGTLTLSLEKTALFKVKIKKEKLKILDYCTYQGDKSIMDEESELNPPFPSEEKEEIDTEIDMEIDEEELEMDSLENPEVAPPQMKETLSSSLDIPFPIVVEVDRIQMPLKKLLNLEPGNILELPMHPEQGVYLTVHGKKIAKGELIKIGEAIGVKIVELGDTPSI